MQPGATVPYYGKSAGAYALTGRLRHVMGRLYSILLPPAQDGSAKRYYLGFVQHNDPATLKAYKIIDLTANAQIPTGNNLPMTADVSTVYAYVDHQYGSGNILPVAILDASPTSGYAPLTVSFSGSGSYDPDGTIVSYAWDFGDGTVGNGISIEHIYTGSGTFTAQLTVTDDKGAQNKSTVTITVVNQAPVVSISAVPTVGTAPLTVTFSGAGSYDPDGTIVSYVWTFGDGTTSSGIAVTHTYTNSGNFTAKLTVTDNVGTTSYRTVGRTVSRSEYRTAGNLSAKGFGRLLPLTGRTTLRMKRVFILSADQR